MIACSHADIIWCAVDHQRRALNEAAWKCMSCLAELGYRPDLDRAHTHTKVHGVLLDFHESQLIYVSNSEMGEVITSNVVRRCQQTDRYDQWTILEYILQDPNMNTH